MDKTFATYWTLEAGAHFSDVEVELIHCAAECVSMHAKFVGCLALVAPVSEENLEQELPFELPNSILVTDASGMHLGDQAV